MCVMSLPVLFMYLSTKMNCYVGNATNTGNGNSSGSDNGGGGGGKQSITISDNRTFKRLSHISSNSTLSGGTTIVTVKQEGAVDSLVPSYVDSTTFVSSPPVQQTNVRQQSNSQNVQLRNTDDCEQVTLPSKLCLFKLHPY